MSVTPHYNKQIQKPIGPPERPDLFYDFVRFIGRHTMVGVSRGCQLNGRGLKIYVDHILRRSI